MTPDREELLREAHHAVDEMQRTAAQKVRAELGPSPRERETGIDPFDEDAPHIMPSTSPRV